MNSLSLGKKVLISIIIALIAVDILSIITVIFAYSTAGRASEIPYKLMAGTVRFILLAIILFALYKGRPIAKWALVVLLLISGVGGLLALPNAFSIYLLIMSVIYTASALLLIFFKPINIFMEYQRMNS